MPQPNSHGVSVVMGYCGPLEGVYRGFCLRGKPDGRGEWVGGSGIGYVGDWRGSRMHGQGKETNCFGAIYAGEFCDDEFVRGTITSHGQVGRFG
jgi:hypothetical protein